MVPLHSRLFGTPGEEKQGWLTKLQYIFMKESASTELEQQWKLMYDDWNLHIGVVHLRAKKYAHKNRLRLVLGHTHCPSEFDGMLVDGGDLPNDGKFVEINDNEVLLRSVE
jgi:hypothetical protein